MKIVVAVFVLLATGSPSWAFHEVASFERSANDGGGGNAYFTGSRRFKGYDCRICHVASEGRISIELEGPLASGRYEAGLIYPIRIKLIGEHRGLDSAFNPNTFALDVSGPDGLPVGTLRGASGSIVEIAGEGDIAIAEGFGNGETEWELSWWAPESAVPATLHVAMLDGDGASDPVNRFIDPLNDDVAVLRVDLCPTAQQCARAAKSSAERAPMGCRVGGGENFGPWYLVLLAVLVVGTPRRILRRKRCKRRLVRARAGFNVEQWP